MEIRGQRAKMGFGPFEADLRSGELRKHGVRLKLQDQPFHVLALLLEHAGEVVTREELRQRLWPEETFVDFDTGLNRAVKKLRDVLADLADQPRYIETIPRRGYRFIGPVNQIGQPTGAPFTNEPTPVPLQGNAPHSAETPRSRFRLVLGFGVVAALGLAAFLTFTTHGRSGNSPLPIKSLAVLPLQNLSGDPAQDYFADGMTEELIGELSRIAALKITSRTSVMQYKGEKNKPLPQIARELNVDTVIEGSVLRSGNQVRITAHMIYAPTDQNLMTETYEGDLGDILKMQREVAESITTKVRAELTPEEQSRLHETPKVDPEAYQAYEVATHVDTNGYQGIRKAQSYLEKSIEKDPNFAPAYIWLAGSYVFDLANRWQSPGEAYPLAKKFIHKALELDERNCAAHQVLYEITWRYNWDWQAAEKEILRGVQLCPNESALHWQYGAYLAVNGRTVEARSEMSKARELDPIESEPFAGEAVIAYHSRDYKALIEIDRAFVEEDPNNWLAHYWFGVGYEGSEQMLPAILEYQKAVALAAGDSDATAALAHAYAASGKKIEAQKILNKWLRQSETGYVSPYMIATIYAGLGNRDKSFEYLEKAYQERSGDLAYFLRADLRVDGLRSDPRFQDLLRRMNFPKNPAN
jgi:TolB-like protein/DNA-binding winged helix-turn-helix (wHTH) protein/Tfp pilus assembly protein PilF